MKYIKLVPFIFSIIILTDCLSQEIMTRREVFNFDINDEFHYKSDIENNGPPNARRAKVINKYYSENSDTVYYELAYNNYTTDFYDYPEPHMEYSFYTDTQTVHYYLLDSTIFEHYVNLRYDTLYKYYGSSEFFYYDSIVEYSTDFCNVLINEFRCAVGDFEPEHYEYQYGKGIGRTKYVYIDEEFHGTDEGLIYYKKGAVACGTPDLTSKINNKVFIDTDVLYPNPVENIIIFNLTNYSFINCELEIFNMQGKSIIRKNITESFFIHDLSGLPEGIYIIKLIMDQKSICRKIIKK